MSIERVCIDHATKYPYNDRQAVDTFELAAQAILADLCDRRGIKHELRETDSDVKEEIVTSLAAIIRVALSERLVAAVKGHAPETYQNLRRSSGLELNPAHEEGVFCMHCGVPYATAHRGDCPQDMTSRAAKAFIARYKREPADDFAGAWLDGYATALETNAQETPAQPSELEQLRRIDMTARAFVDACGNKIGIPSGQFAELCNALDGRLPSSISGKVKK